MWFPVRSIKWLEINMFPSSTEGSWNWGSFRRGSETHHSWDPRIEKRPPKTMGNIKKRHLPSLIKEIMKPCSTFLEHQKNNYGYQQLIKYTAVYSATFKQKKNDGYQLPTAITEICNPFSSACHGWPIPLCLIGHGHQILTSPGRFATWKIPKSLVNHRRRWAIYTIAIKNIYTICIL